MKLIQTLLLLPILSFGQTITTLTSLNTINSESSGLLYLDNRIITHNDSGGEAVLYEIDSINGEITRKVIIENASNIDWEDICSDENSIYIGDVGNNIGNRIDLKIYKIAIDDYYNNDTVVAEIINFEYADQIDFSNQLYTTNYDAEALISYGDSLYLFSKNWGNTNSLIYTIPKSPGNYIVNTIDTLINTGLVTGATLNPITNEVLLTSYNLVNASIIELKNFHSGLFSNGIMSKYNINTSASHQIEAICSISDTEHQLAAESNNSGEASLYKLISNSVAIQELKTKVLIFPNPTSNLIYINAKEQLQFEIYTITGKLILSCNESQMDVSTLPSSVYILKYSELNSNLYKSHRICVK